MDLATGAMGTLLPKLLEILGEEYKLQKGVREGVKSLEKEMRSMHVALRKVAEVPREQLDEQIKLWAGEVRELSFDMEDIVDKFLVHVGEGSEPAANSNKLKRLTKKMSNLFTKGKARHEIADAIKDINKQVQEVAARRARYNVDNTVANLPPVTSIDPRLGAMYTEATGLVGIAGTRDQEIMKLLSEGDDISKKNLKIVSVVGFGGLGKTTLVKTVYDKIEGDYDCKAFVPVGRKAEAKTVFTNILLNLGMNGSELIMLNEKLLIDKLREFLKNKRYLIVIDDIWDEELWTVIKCAFSSSNNFDSRLITTTRIVSVSESCCSSTNDSIYIMEPLSDDDSKSLFYKRIFSLESGCPPEYEEVSRHILKKCGGVPLAIITIASLLTTGRQVKPKNEWHVLLESIGRGLTENCSAKEMLRILSFSYYDLPSHLKTCLLYLSMFPEDMKISKEHLIWLWIVESFVQSGKEKTSLFEVGETYFNELVNRSLIQPIYDDDYGSVYACRVHDSVLDLICSLSSEENFVTILNGNSDTMSSEGIVRRLSLQNARKEEDQTGPFRSESVQQVRSVITFAPAFDIMPPFSSFVVLCVLELDGYDGSKNDDLNLRELGGLLHLRYLLISGEAVNELPEEIGKLQFLQVLVVEGCKRFPSTVIKLTRLMCLGIIGGRFQPPNGVGNLRSMEVVSKIKVGSVSIVKELGNMQRLRELDIQFESLELVEPFVESLGKMQNIQRVKIITKCERQVSMNLLGEGWAPPASLRVFIMYKGVGLSRLPAWSPYHLPQLFKLDIRVEELRQEDLKFLERLPALRILGLRSDNQRPLLFAAEGFRCLERVTLDSESPSKILFQPGALPKAERVNLCIGLLSVKEEAAGNGGDWFDMGMENLPSLQKVNVVFHRSGVTVGEAKLAEAALEKALRAHPNRPTIYIRFDKRIPEGGLDEDVYIKDEESE